MSDEVYDAMPYFFTDQYDLGMEYVGNAGPDGYDQVVVRGDDLGRAFTASGAARRPGRRRHARQRLGRHRRRSARLVGQAVPENFSDTGVPLSELGAGAG